MFEILLVSFLFGVQTPPVADRAPRALTQLRDAAVAACGPALAGEWTTVADQLKAMRSAVADLPSDATQPDLRRQLNARMQAFQMAVRDERGADAAANANWVARIADEMATHYEATVPGDVRLLGFFGRAAEIDAARHRRARVKTDVADLHTVWRRVEPAVLQMKAADAARQVTDAIVRLEGASASADISAAAEAEVSAANRIVALFQSRAARQ